MERSIPDIPILPFPELPGGAIASSAGAIGSGLSLGGAPASGSASLDLFGVGSRLESKAVPVAVFTAPTRFKSEKARAGAAQTPDEKWGTPAGQVILQFGLLAPCCWAAGLIAHIPAFWCLQRAWMTKVWTTSFSADAADSAKFKPCSTRFVPPFPDFSARPTLEPLCLKPFTVWAPLVTFKGIVTTLLCPSCGSTSKRKSSAPPRWIRGMSGSELLLASKHECKDDTKRGCTKKFLSTDDAVLGALPALIREQFPFVLTHQSAVTKEYVCLLCLGSLLIVLLA
jgi:hypothetical protein